MDKNSFHQYQQSNNNHLSPEINHNIWWGSKSCIWNRHKIVVGLNPLMESQQVYFWLVVKLNKVEQWSTLNLINLRIKFNTSHAIKKETLKEWMNVYVYYNATQQCSIMIPQFPI